jgi:DNA-binding IclR family transcriptional regulator
MSAAGRPAPSRDTEPPEPGVPHSQTLDRGLRALETVAGPASPMTIDQLAERLGLHRSVTYRIVRTLEDHLLVRRDAAGRLHPGLGLSALAQSVEATLQAAAAPPLAALADELGMTAFLVVRERDEAVTVLTVEPRNAAAHVTYRPGARHPVTAGAPGLALLAAAPPIPGERPEVALARSRGWAWSQGEVIPGMSSVAVAINANGGATTAGDVPAYPAVSAACAVVFVHTGQDLEAIGDAVARCAAAIPRGLG